MSIPFKEGNGFDVVGLRKHVNRCDLREAITASGDQAEITCQGCRITGYGDDLPGPKQGQKSGSLAQSLTGGI